MLKISSKKSVMFSIVLSVAVFIALAAGALFMPYLVELYLNLKFGAVTMNYYLPVMVLGYTCLVLTASADVMLIRLLLRVKDGNVFTDKSVALIRGISWSVIFLGVTFFILGFYFLIAFLVAFACMFLGLCVRVVKNVIELASKIKAENDFTI